MVVPCSRAQIVGTMPTTYFDGITIYRDRASCNPPSTSAARNSQEWNTCRIDTAAVITRHLLAVQSGDPEAMAADYAEHAVLVRGECRHQGRDAIRDYFVGLSLRFTDDDLKSFLLFAPKVN